MKLSGPLAVATLAVIASAVTVSSTVIAFAILGCLTVGAALAWARGASRRLVLGLYIACLFGYALFGRGFAYVGVSPVYIGEVMLFVGAAYWIISRPRFADWFTPITGLLVLFMVISAAATVSYVPTYGLDAMRDAAIWGYGAIALVVVALTLRGTAIDAWLTAYSVMVPLFLLWTPVALVLYRLFPESIPVHGGSGVPILHPKSGDVSVHLVGTLGFLVLGLGEKQRRVVPETIIWACWLLAFVGVLISRGAMLTVLSGFVILLVFRPFGRWGKVFATISLGVLAFVGFDVKIQWGSQRTISTEGLTLAVRSIFAETNEGPFDGSRSWRLSWWNDIFEYTFGGDRFWTGKGYGVNLADVDGYQVLSGSALRSPHNGHLTILARSGVPGFAAWTALQLVFAVSLMRAYFTAKRNGRDNWARLNLWILAYWLAFLVNASFDVYLEGPQGGIWFWSIFGLGAAAIEHQRRKSQIPDESQSAVIFEHSLR